ncbi:Protein pbn1 [Colletotrichum sp. SAR 10_99]|nr:Protein pbn1 [Colletotrichum sp. SAR 10_96]KAI8280450.1 Protein pbn1 [Colletotrichum sp. SAR 10_98]KAJ5013955.1 Protein pbn1 [Colletotrichum sp. SAR 10_99]
MRQRITFIHKPGNGVPFEALEISDAGVKGPEIDAVREDRVTLALEELPAELSQLLTFQYYEPLGNLTKFIHYTSQTLCPASNTSCKSRAEDLKTAASLDISYDTISHALKITAQWPYTTHKIDVASTPKHRTEVGILTTDSSAKPEPHEIGMTGGLTVLGEHTKPSPVLFNVPARHRRHDEVAAGSSFSAKFLEPTGLHPALQLTVSSARPPVDDAYCAIHAHFTLPKTIFADRYQLADDLFLQSKNLTALRYSSSPVDLEAPAYATKPWGSGVLLELTPPTAQEQDTEWTAEIPLHLRYLKPADGGYTDLEVPHPAVFWACSSEEGTKFPSSPFERVNLGYDALFGPRTVFWHVEPVGASAGGGGGGSRLTSSVRVPVLEAGQAGWVRMGTAGAVMLGFAWVLWRLVAAYSRTGYGKGAAAKAEEKKTQ